MTIKIRALLKALLGRLKDMASLFTALGTMFVPLAVVVWTQNPSSGTAYWWGVAFAVLGISSLILGWVNVIREERQRRREGKAFMYMLTRLAEKSGVNLNDAVKELGRILDGK